MSPTATPQDGGGVASHHYSRGNGMADLWYYGRGADLFGPFSGWQVAELADAGEVLATDMVWEDAAEDGVPAHTIPHLFPTAVAVAAPVAAPVVPPSSAPLSAPYTRPATSTRRAVAGPGVIITGQDGKTVRFLKKCTTCGKQDRSTSSAIIVCGTMRLGFFCPKCRRRRPVEIQGR